MNAEVDLGIREAFPADRHGERGHLGVDTSIETVRSLSESHGVVPVRLRRVDDLDTAVSALLKLRKAFPGQPTFLLESAEQGMRFGRWSFIGVSSQEPVTWSLGDPGDPYEIARELVGRNDVAPLDGLPPFLGGAVGVFGYDLVRTVEPIGDPNPDPLGTPDLALMVVDALIAFDHLKHEHQIIGLVRSAEGDIESGYKRAVGQIQALHRALLDPVPTAEDLSEHPAAGTGPDWQANMTREQFESNVAKIIDYVYAGDAFQVVPSQRWSAELGVDPFAVYRGLRVVNPSPYMYFIDFGDWQIAGASPEPLIKVNGRKIMMRPIAGTRPRGASATEDSAIAQGLLEDEKERAEHVMLVDLGRNDLGRVCDYGTVAVDEMMVIETYSHVLHIVSQVVGELREGVDGMAALRAVLPAGTLSGAPKVRAMEIIDEIEPVKRGGYGGAVGYLSWNGDLDSAIHIRTVVFKDGMAHVQAGGGTVADAKPEYEYEESMNKSRAVRSAVDLALQQPSWNIEPLAGPEAGK